MDAQLVQCLTESTCEVFRTMVACDLEPGTPLLGEAAQPGSHVVGTVGFGGSRLGLVAFHGSLDAAREIAGRLLGISAGEVRGEIADAIGEVTNMIAGSFRTRMAGRGESWAISIPTVTVGTDFSITPRGYGQRAVIPFRMPNHGDLFVELLLTSR